MTNILLSIDNKKLKEIVSNFIYKIITGSLEYENKEHLIEQIFLDGLSIDFDNSLITINFPFNNSSLKFHKEFHINELNSVSLIHLLKGEQINEEIKHKELYECIYECNNYLEKIKEINIQL